jgi:hypothetical protein
MHIDTLRAAVGNADDMIKYLAVDDLWLGGAGEAKTRFPRWTDMALVNVIRGNEDRSWRRRDGLRCGRVSPAGQKNKYCDQLRPDDALAGTLPLPDFYHHSLTSLIVDLGFWFG